MKKKMIFAGVAMLLTAVAVTGYMAYQRTQVSDLFSANVEAITAGESGSTMYQSMARCNGFNLVWACTSKRYAELCSRYYCKVDF